MAARKTPKSKPSAESQVDAQLDRYRAMRDFGVTAEPSGASKQGAAVAAAQLPFVIQKHAATRLHYDFRLGWRGVLKSWACAKGPSYTTKDRRLAVEVEDHPIEYGGFEGTIPKGQYGGGTVLLWDQGTWEPQAGHEDIDAGLKAGSLKFILHGEKLHGRWTLVRMGGRAANEAKPNWLLIKEHDEFERPAEALPIIEEAPDSVVTGRSLEQIAAAEDHVWQSRPAENAKTPRNHSRLAKVAIKGEKVALARDRSQDLKGIPEEAFPGFVSPQLATAAHDPPPGPEWLHELKLDGYRVQVHVEKAVTGRNKVTIYTRNGLDWTPRMKDVAHAASQLPVGAAILDGEVVVLDEHGNSSFALLQAAFDEGAKHPMTLFAFDLLHMDGHNLRGLPLVRRKALLQGLLQESAADPALAYGEHLDAPAAETFSKACELGAEGIISKLGTSKYTGGRSKDWLKLKCVRRQEFVVGGYTLPGDGGGGIGALLLGVYEGERLVYCGRTGTGFTQASARMLRTKLEPLEQSKAAFAGTLPAEARKGARWVRPEHVAEVQFATWTGDAMVRHAAFQGLREDKAPTEVVRENAGLVAKPQRVKAAAPEETPVEKAPEPIAQPAAAAASKPRPAGNIGSIRLTHPDKIIDAESGVTKQQLAEYLLTVSGAMLPHVAERPLSLVRCPNGSTKPCFFQKHAGVGMPKGVGSVPVPGKNGEPAEQYISIDSAEALASLAQIGVLEVHPWGSCNKALETPDRLIFDLDPDESLEWSVLVASARAVREFLKELGLASFVKTTGGKGLHVVVPLSSGAGAPDWAQIKLFTRGVALAIESTDPKLYLIKMTKAARKGRIFIDYMRNERGSTAIAAYSPRARSGLRVALPLAWDELEGGRPEFTVNNFAQWQERLKKDPWAGLPKLKQKISKATLEAVMEAGRSG